MKKKVIISLLLIVLCSLISYYYFENNNNTSVITYNNGDILKVSIDGVESDTLPSSGLYYLSDYKCKSSDTKLEWDRENNKLNVTNNNKKSGIYCYLTFESQPKLSSMPVGSYVAYVGNNGCDGDECLGYNPNQRTDMDTKGSYGHCDSKTGYHSITYGWRFMYSKNGNAYIVSAGSPECIGTDVNGEKYINSTSDLSSSLSSTNLEQHFVNLNNEALKYCNADFIYGGNCSLSNDYIRSINAADYKIITGISIIAAKWGFKKKYGYGNDLIDTGVPYWFALRVDSSANTIYMWDTYSRQVSYKSSYNVVGFRPVLGLESSVVVVGGSGTMEDPYQIANNAVRIDKYVKASNSIRLIGTNATQMCISVDNSVCSNYIDFSNTYNLNLSSYSDGKHTVYVYYKDGNGTLVKSFTKEVILDTTAPTNNSVVVSKTVSNIATLSTSSTGADYMCISSSNDVNNCEWIKYSKSYRYAFDRTNGSKTIYSWFKDNAGNVSSMVTTNHSCTTCEDSFYVDYKLDGSDGYTISSINAEGLIRITTPADTSYKVSPATLTDTIKPFVINRSNNMTNTNVTGLISDSYGINSSVALATITFTPTTNSTLSFKYGVSSESSYDKFNIRLVGSNSTNVTLVANVSGTSVVNTTSAPLTADVTYTLVLQYRKDSSTSTKDDMGYIKDFHIE